MKRAPYLYIIILPYIIALGTYLVFGDDLAAFFNDENGIALLIIYGIFILISFILAIIAVIAGAIFSAKSLSSKETAVWNLITKLVHLPMHVLCFIFFGGMMNPFLFMISWVRILESICLQVFSGTLNIGACIKGYKSGKMGTGASVIMAML